MFMVFNKDKIGAYIVLLSTVIILFGIAFSMREGETTKTSANAIIQTTVNTAYNDNYIVCD